MSLEIDRRALHRATWLGLVFAGFGLRLYLAWQPIEVMVGRSLSDDAFYYFKIAQNISQGVGPTFDGVGVTNGYHPLWMLICVSVYRLLPSSDLDLPIHVILTIGAVLDISAAVILQRTLARWSSPVAGLVGLALYSLNPISASMAVCGVETPLQMFALSLFICRSVGALASSSEGHLTLSHTLGLGLSTACVWLTRLDNVFLILPVVFFSFFAPGVRPVLRTLLLLILVLAMLPWLVWNIHVVGTIVPDSAFAISALKGMHALSLEGILRTLLDLVGVVSFWIPTYSGSLYLLVAETAVAVVAFRTLLPQTTFGRPPLEIVAAVLSVALFIQLVFHVVVRHSVRPWYVTPLSLLACLFAGVLVTRLRHSAGHPGLTALVFLFLATIIIPNARFLKQGFWPHGLEMYRMAGVIHESIPPHERVGAFNAGILGYFSGRRIVNLDGLVNHDIQPYLRHGGIAEYLRVTNISYIADDPDTIRSYSPFLECLEGEEACPEYSVLKEIAIPHSIWATPGIQLLRVEMRHD